MKWNKNDLSFGHWLEETDMKDLHKLNTYIGFEATELDLGEMALKCWIREMNTNKTGHFCCLLLTRKTKTPTTVLLQIPPRKTNKKKKKTKIKATCSDQNPPMNPPMFKNPIQETNKQSGFPFHAYPFSNFSFLIITEEKKTQTINPNTHLCIKRENKYMYKVYCFHEWNAEINKIHEGNKKM